MKKLALMIIAITTSPAAQADDFVNGYTRHDGTYVQPHYRSEANEHRYDNYSSQGNSNPYTGERGHERNEYSNPPAYNQSNSYDSIYQGYGN